MASEDIAPDSTLVSQVTFTETDAGNIDDDPDSPDANWALIGGNNVSGDIRVSFATPTGNPTGTQTIKAEFRQQSVGQTGTPLADIQVWENGGGAPIASTGDTSITSESSQVITLNWDASLLTTADGSLVEVLLVVTKSGGSPGARESCDIGSVKWVCEYSVGGSTRNRIILT
jgi:hypothetical protein